jgi:integrase
MAVDLGGQMKLDDFAVECWKFLPVTQKTVENYRGAYLRNISPILGHREMPGILKREFLDALAPLAAPNYIQTLMALRVIYREAVSREMISHSPLNSIRPPKSYPKPQKFLTWEEVSRINFGKYDQHIKFLALHGLRWGEAVALTSEDIYDDKVHITRSKYGPTKSVSGVREVPYFGHFKPFPKTRKAIAGSLSPHGVTIHSLRKTYAYFLKTNDVHVTAAARFLGHADPMLTLKIYTLVRDEEIVLIGKRLREKMEN